MHFVPFTPALQEAERQACHYSDHRIKIKTDMEHNFVLSCK